MNLDEKIADLVAQAGLPPVEVSATPTDVTVCFRHGRSASRPAAADLTPLQRRLLEVLAQTGPASLGEIMSRLDPGTARRTVQRGLHTLRERGLVNSTGKYRHAQWELTGEAH